MSNDVQKILNDGVRHHQAGRLGEAEKAYRDVLAAAPRHVEGLHLLGLLELQRGRAREAVALVEQAIALTAAAPVAEYHGNLAAALRALGLRDRAVAHLKIAADLKTGDPVAQFRAGLVLLENGAPGEAVAYLKRAIVLKPDFAEAHSNFGISLRHLARFEEASSALRTAVSLQPQSTEAHYSLGVALKDMGRIQEAITCFEAAAALDPAHAGAQWNAALGHLLRGEFAEGWKTFDWHEKIKGASVHEFRQPAWDGGDLAGKTILLTEEHGYGDTLQFMRFAGALKQRAGRVLVSCRPELARLVASVPGVDAVFSGAELLPDFDCHASFFDLPKLLDTTLESIPAEVPYCAVETEQVEVWRGRNVLRPGVNAGLVWRGNKKTDPRRSVGVAEVARVCAQPGMNWLSLQVGAEPEECGAISPDLRDCGSMLTDWADTAALISILDVVVTVDTGVAHLAGALGKPVWILLPFVPDWRWLLERRDSPWYPSARLFRQPAIGDWGGAITQICAELPTLTRG